MLNINVTRHNMMTEERGIRKSRSFNIKRMLWDASPPARQTHSFLGDDISNPNLMEPINNNNNNDSNSNNRTQSSICSPCVGGKQDWSLPELNSPEVTSRHMRSPVSRLSVASSPIPPSPSSSSNPSSDLEMMKEKFSKLLLGEDMSGGGKGVSSALALSNAITNLAASVFGQQTKLEPMSPDRKQRWKKEMDWLLSVTDYVVELVPKKQVSNGKTMEIMVTEQREDLRQKIPALRKLDEMLINCLDQFQDKKDFWYVSKDADDSEKGVQRDDKWWLPTVKVTPNGLSDDSRRLLQNQKDSVGQVLKASMAINSQVIAEMEVPENYIESLPKNGRSSLGDIIYKSITFEYFDPDQLLSSIDMSSEHKVVDLKNKFEASIEIWKRKMHHKDGKSTWGSAISMEKRELFEDRAETILQLLKERFPGLPQSNLEISKIQYNKDVGHAIIESYSRVLESLAYTVTNRIENILFADSIERDPSLAITKMRRTPSRDPSPSPNASGMSSPSYQDLEKEVVKLNSTSGTPTSTSVTLLDAMGWDLEQPDSAVKRSNSVIILGDILEDESNEKTLTKPTITVKKFSYIDKVECGLRSPTSRH